jgi:hypothetical protein
MALFGAIVVIGLGPAMWLGAQFGAATETADRPPTVTTVQQNGTPSGGSGAGDAPTGAGEITDEPVANNQPRSTRTVRPRPARSSPSPSESETSPTPPVQTSSPSPSKPPVDPPQESTTPPTDPPTKDVPPSSPSDGSTDPGDVKIERVYGTTSSA